MATNLVSLVMDVLTPDIIARIAAALGLDRGAAQKAIGAAVPALLAAFAGSAAKPGGAGRLFDAVNQQGSGVLTNLAKTLDGSGPTALAERGSGLLASLLGGSTQSELANAVGKFAGISEGKGASLLGILGPIAMGALRKQQTASGLDASGLANLLASQGSNISAALPSAFANLLARDGRPRQPGRSRDGDRNRGRSDNYRNDAAGCRHEVPAQLADLGDPPDRIAGAGLVFLDPAGAGDHRTDDHDDDHTADNRYGSEPYRRRC